MAEPGGPIPDLEACFAAPLLIRADIYARVRRAERVGGIDVLLAIASSKCEAAAVLRELGIQPPRLSELEMSSEQPPTQVDWPCDLWDAGLLPLASEESTRRGYDFLSSMTLLLAVMKHPDPQVDTVLGAAGASRSEIHQRISDRLAESPLRDAQTVPWTRARMSDRFRQR